MRMRVRNGYHDSCHPGMPARAYPGSISPRSGMDPGSPLRYGRGDGEGIGADGEAAV